MKKHRDKDLVEVMSNASFMLDMGRAIITAVMSKKGKISHLRRLLSDQARLERIADIMIADDLAQVGVIATVTPPRLTEPPPTLTTHELAVDYRKTVEQMLKAGEYDGRVHPGVTTANYPVTGSGTQQLTGTLVHFGRYMKDAAVDAWCAANNYRRATALEILTFGVAYKQLQRQFPIISGQSAFVGDDWYVVCIVGCIGRSAILEWNGDEWNDFCRFLVFPQ